MVPAVNSELFRAPQRKTAVETVIGKIKELILTGQIKPGDRLPNELELSESLGASRGSVREALKILDAFGIIDIRRGDGTYIADSVNSKMFDHILFHIILSGVDKHSLMELRELMEIGIASIIIKRTGTDSIAPIRRAHSDMETLIQSGSADPQQLTQADLAFHQALADATGNDLIVKIYGFVLELFVPSIHATHTNKRHGLNAFRLHTQIVDALEGKDMEKAKAAILESIEDWVRYS